MPKRIEFGFPRTNCDCKACQLNCRWMPGFLVPADLKRMIPEDMDPFAYANENLLASPGALVAKNGQTFRVPTLVPAVRQNGSCIHLHLGRCMIHEIAPFGCAFFDCQSPPGGQLAHDGIVAVMEAHVDITSLYSRLWHHLLDGGRVQLSAEKLRAIMREVS